VTKVRRLNDLDFHERGIMDPSARTNQANADPRSGAAKGGIEFPAVSRGRRLAFRITAGLLGLFFLYAGLSNAIAPWVAVPAMAGDLHPELHRWFSAVAGASDLIAAGCFLALAWRPTQTLLFFFLVVGILLAAGINLPFAPGFAIILALTLPALATYPYWSQLRGVAGWWHRPHVIMLAIAALAAIPTFVIAALALGHQIDGADSAAQANWWADYAEHVSLPVIAALVASSGRPGWRLLGGLAAAVCIYLGAVATFVLTDDAGSWGKLGGPAGMAFGLTLAIACLSKRPLRAQ
jgi:hypothetical protein